MARQRGHVVTIANTKGGVGKSTIAGNLAWAFALTSRTAVYVLLVRCRPSGISDEVV